MYPTRLCGFVAYDPYYLGRRLHSRILHGWSELTASSWGPKRLQEAVQRRATAIDFLRSEVTGYYRRGCYPTTAILSELVADVENNRPLELPHSEELRLWQQAWVEQRFRPLIAGQDRGSLPPYWHRYLPLYDRYGKQVEWHVARMIGILPPPGVPLRAVVGAVFGLNNPIEYSAERVEALARGGVVVFVLDMPIAQADVLAELPTQRRFLHHLGLTYTVADFFDEIDRIVALHPELQRLPRGGLGESLGGYFIPEAAVILGRNLSIERLALYAPRLVAGSKYGKSRRLVDKTGWLLRLLPQLAATKLSYHPKSPPDRRPVMTEAAYQRALALHNARVGVDNLHPALGSMFADEVQLMEALHHGGHSRLPKHLRIGYFPNDEEVDITAIEDLIRLAEVARDGALETVSMSDHSATKYQPGVTLPPLVHFFTDHLVTAADLGVGLES